MCLYLASRLSSGSGWEDSEADFWHQSLHDRSNDGDSYHTRTSNIGPTIRHQLNRYGVVSKKTYFRLMGGTVGLGPDVRYYFLSTG